ncbi:MAG: TetR/AcrR family transcriptional regulator [Hyphomicrobiaceae bacterium]|nr:TetR/AcrR family transcriptional regulator [Hyphomicrobiaceae bacterium]
MARPRTFDNDTVLDAAVGCFWRHGLEGTSVRELAHEMGLSGPSLYNAFGDKRALFMQALERYASTVLRERIGRLEAMTSPAAAIEAFFEELIDRSLGDPERRGCLLINSALEAAPHDPEIAKVVSTYFAEIESFLRTRIEVAQMAGEVPATLDAADMGRLLLGVLIAIRVLARTGAERKQLAGMARPALDLLGRRAWATLGAGGGATEGSATVMPDS